MSQTPHSLLMESLGLPLFNTLDEFAKLTGLSTRLLYLLSMKTEDYYKHITIPKKSGGYRQISIPSYTLHILQRWILVKILNPIALSNRAMAFRRGSQFGHKQNAFYHSHTLFGLSLDLKDFFPSIGINKIYTAFSSLGYSKFAASILTNICTLEGKLPQGSACSPALSNIICRTLDKRLIGLCEKRGIRYTRYADDMYFSCDDKALLLKNFTVIKKIIADEGFTLNDRKVHFHTPSNKKRITGITVTHANNEDVVELKAPRQMKMKIRAEIFKCIMSGDYTEISHILGEISYVNFIEKETKNPFLPRIKKYISSTGNKICLFPELVDAYNTNLFYSDLEPLKVQTIDVFDDEYMNYLSYALDERQKFISKNNIKDICQYKDWPEMGIDDDTLPNDQDLPF